MIAMECLVEDNHNGIGSVQNQVCLAGYSLCTFLLIIICKQMFTMESLVEDNHTAIICPSKSKWNRKC